MRSRIAKFANVVAFVFLVVVTWRFLHGEIGYRYDLGALGISTLWLALTEFDLRGIQRTYLNVSSRLRVWIPFGIGILFSYWALAETHSLFLKAIAVIELVLWIRVCWRFRHTRGNYKKLGDGLIDTNMWVDPPAEAFQVGGPYLLLTHGNIAKVLHEGVGHGEVVLRKPLDFGVDDYTSIKPGELCTFTSLKDGAIFRPIEDTTVERQHGHYVAFQLSQPIDPNMTADEIDKLAWRLAYLMKKENVEYTQQAQAKLDKVFNRMPLPSSVKSWLCSKIRPTGYDWLGIFTGRETQDHWTCFSGCLELYSRLGVRTRQYVVGFFGIGKGLLNPAEPIEAFRDPAFRALTMADKAAFEQKLS